MHIKFVFITLTASNMLRSALVCAVSFCVRSIETFFNTFIAKNWFISRPLVLRTYRMKQRDGKIDFFLVAMIWNSLCMGRLIFLPEKLFHSHPFPKLFSIQNLLVQVWHGRDSQYLGIVEFFRYLRHWKWKHNCWVYTNNISMVYFLHNVDWLTCRIVILVQNHPVSIEKWIWINYFCQSVGRLFFLCFQIADN